VNNLKKIRKERNLTQLEVAKGTGLSLTWIAYAEKHEGLLSILAKKRIADFLKIDIKEIFSEGV